MSLNNFCFVLAFSAEKQDMKKVYDTANFYHFLHTLALLGVPLTKRPYLVRYNYNEKQLAHIS